MKAQIYMDDDGEASICLEPENQKEASRIVRLALNADSQTRRIIEVHARKESIAVTIRLTVRRDRLHGRGKTEIKPIDQ